MKFLIILSGILAVVSSQNVEEFKEFSHNQQVHTQSSGNAEDKTCYRGEKVKDACDYAVNMKQCDSSYGHVDSVEVEFQNYVKLHFNSSFNYLLMTSYYGGYEKNREGLEKIFRHLSDRTWNDAIELIKYINKRGIKMIWNAKNKTPGDNDGGAAKGPGHFKLNEIQSIAHALDSQKLIANDAIKIHKKTSEKGEGYDPEVASFLENHFLHQHADIIRNLAGLISDLSVLLGKSDKNAISVFLFDEYLKKIM